MDGRSRLLAMAVRRAARGHGSSAMFLKERTAMQPIPDLNAILGPVRWVLIGGLATRAYMPERMTQDVDILIHVDDAHAAHQRLLVAGYQWVSDLSIGGFSVRRAGEPPLDVVTRADAWVEAALQNPTVDLAGYPVLGLPYLILMKLDAGRLQDLADCARMLHGTSPELRETIRQTLQQARSPYMDDLEQLILLADAGMDLG